MNEHMMGALLFAVVGLLFWAVHLGAYRDPQRNAVTRMIDGYYANWHEPPERRRRLLRNMAWGWFAIAVVGSLIAAWILIGD